MDTLLQISGFLRQHRWVVLAIGIVLGLLVGLAIGWWWFPVEWSNATPGQLRWDFRDDYVVWVAQQYESSGDVDWARSKLGVEYWGGKDEVAQIMDEVATKRSGDDAVRINALKQVLVAQEGGGSDEATAGGRSLLANAWPICLVFLVVVFVAGGGLYLYSRWRGRQLEDQAKGRRPPAERARPVEQVSWGAEGPPLAQFPTTYTLGDDHYDPSFSVELETGEFMGECGVASLRQSVSGRPTRSPRSRSGCSTRATSAL